MIRAVLAAAVDAWQLLSYAQMHIAGELLDTINGTTTIPNTGERPVTLNDPKMVHQFDQISAAPVVWRITCTEAGHSFELADNYAQPQSGKELLHTIGLMQSVAHVTNDIIQELAFTALKGAVEGDDSEDIEALRNMLFRETGDNDDDTAPHPE